MLSAMGGPTQGDIDAERSRIKRDIGRRIKSLRSRAQLTQQQVADRLGMTRQNVLHYEKGLALPSAEDMPRLARALECEVADLYGHHFTRATHDQYQELLEDMHSVFQRGLETLEAHLTLGARKSVGRD